MLPIKKVILYKHGVGYFERTGEVNGDATLDLNFKSMEMNDVLKSLTVLDLSGGIISSISYESTKPVERQLEDIAIHLDDSNALTGLISQIKGARVRLLVGTEEIIGKVTGVETVKKLKDGVILPVNFISVMVDGHTLKSFDIFEIKSLTLLDDNLKGDIEHILEVLIQSKKKDSKKLTLYAQGEGERSIMASYVVETPVWKVSYRVLLDKEKSTIQGWALVDNTQDEDWKNVSLTLVSGLPISFVHDLYSPRYKKRPIIEVQEEEAYAPPVLEQAMPMEMEADECFAEVCAMDAMPAKRMRSKSIPMAAPAPGMSRQEARKKSAPVQTRTVEIGDLFQYQISNPVTVKRNQSALVPILYKEFSGKKIAIYNEEIRDKNPMTAVLFKNDTGLTLEGGPVTMVEQETYVGEAMLDTLKPGEEKIVPYSVELGCRVLVEKDTDPQKFFQARISYGYLYLDYYLIKRTRYKFHNKTDKPMDMILEHRKNHNMKLYESPKPYEETDNFYRFRFGVTNANPYAYEIKEKQVTYTSYSLWNFNQDQLVSWGKNGYIDRKANSRLEEILGLSEQLGNLQREIDEANYEMEDIGENQDRVRENLHALGESADEKKLRERYVTQLSKEEDRLMELKDEIKKLKDNKQQVEDKRQKLINELTMEKKI
ncbi:MAG: hypothetical protein ACLFQV_11665 [Vulcanimicrobiota bacterium]